MLYRCLIVDDNRDCADATAMVLEVSGYVTRVAYGGRDARISGRAFLPHVALIDLLMPGQDGYALADSFRRDPMLQTTALVAHSGHVKLGDAQEARERGFDFHLRKPAMLQDLLKVLQDACQMASRRSLQDFARRRLEMREAQRLLARERRLAAVLEAELVEQCNVSTRLAETLLRSRTMLEQSIAARQAARTRGAAGIQK